MTDVETKRKCTTAEQHQPSEAPLYCPGCGAFVDDDGYSIDHRCCFYCKAD